MTGLEARQAAQHVTVKNRKYVIVEAGDRQAMIEWLETGEVQQVFQQAMAEVKAAGGEIRIEGASLDQPLEVAAGNGRVALPD